MSWDDYLKATSNSKCRPLLREAFQYLKKTDRGNALDLGAGALGDTSFLLKAGFTVIAVDSNPKILEYSKPHENLSVEISSFENYSFPENSFDLINAQYALPFNKPETFESVFQKMILSMKDSAIFTGQLFGTEDGWAEKKTMTFLSAEQVNKLMENFKKVHVLREEKKLGPTATGIDKFWHVFHIIAEK
ncbi:MAG: class SAM-dependent methyltransferase [Parcubacteria group bacterium]|nr:class SAM-dependent methyltransferase [Parcubacteria group bacterium]